MRIRIRKHPLLDIICWLSFVYFFCYKPNEHSTRWLLNIQDENLRMSTFLTSMYNTGYWNATEKLDNKTSPYFFEDYGKLIFKLTPMIVKDEQISYIQNNYVNYKTNPVILNSVENDKKAEIPSNITNSVPKYYHLMMKIYDGNYALEHYYDMSMDFGELVYKNNKTSITFKSYMKKNDMNDLVVATPDL